MTVFFYIYIFTPPNKYWPKNFNNISDEEKSLKRQIEFELEETSKEENNQIITHTELNIVIDE